MRLLGDSFSVVAFDYRGFPAAGETGPPPAPVTFGRLVRDLETVLQAAGADRVHLAGWCLGAKLAWELYARHPRRVRSILAVGPAYQGPDHDPGGVFAETMEAVGRRVARDPGALAAMCAVLRVSGFIPDDAFFRGLPGDGEGRPPPAPGGGYHLNATPAGLRGYLPLYQAFRSHRIDSHFAATAVPVTVVNGTEDRITPLTPRVRAELAAIPRARVVAVEGASHYLPLERPRLLATLLFRQAEECTLSVTPPPPPCTTPSSR
jgi:pimeloyl-ACP methyl ester carboxylesterase